jgi:hypothetical protein
MKYLLFRNAVHMPKEERLRTRYAKLQHAVARPKTRVLQDLSTHAKESISLQKASEWAQSHVVVSNGKFESPGHVGVVVKHALCDYVAMLCVL